MITGSPGPQQSHVKIMCSASICQLNMKMPYWNGSTHIDLCDIVTSLFQKIEASKTIKSNKMKHVIFHRPFHTTTPN